MALGAQGGEYCVNDCDRIPELVPSSFESAETQPSFDTDAVTKPYTLEPVTWKLNGGAAQIEDCCADPDLAPFEIFAGQMGHHCWTCGKVFK